MRLIDADALIEVIKKYKFGAISNESEREYTREIMLCFVNGSSTAYDISKVVAGLEEKKKALHALRGLEDDYYMGKECGYRDAIDIVRKGGVWNDY